MKIYPVYACADKSGVQLSEAPPNGGGLAPLADFLSFLESEGFHGPFYFQVSEGAFFRNLFTSEMKSAPAFLDVPEDVEDATVLELAGEEGSEGRWEVLFRLCGHPFSARVSFGLKKGAWSFLGTQHERDACPFCGSAKDGHFCPALSTNQLERHIKRLLWRTPAVFDSIKRHPERVRMALKGAFSKEGFQ